MPSKKKQHFVPKYLLRKFAADSSEQQINMIHIESKRFISCASLKKQCYKNYFYSKEEFFENALSKIEASQSKILNFIIEKETLQPFSLGDITLFIAIQLFRTDMSQKIQNDLMEPLYKMIVKDIMEEKIPTEVLKKIKISANYEVNPLVKISIQLSPMLYDLKRTLIVNRTKTPFIISDHPVIVTNKFCRQYYKHKSGKGLGISGAQIFIPISPEYGIFLYDSGVYQTTNSGRMVVTKEKDIDLFNCLQWLNAKNSVYIPPRFPDVKITDLINTKGRTEKRVRFNRAEKSSNDGDYIDTGKTEYDDLPEGVTSEVVMMSDIPLPYDINFKGFSMRDKKVFDDDGSFASPRRDPVWIDIINDFGLLMDKRKIFYSQLSSFISMHPLASEISFRTKKNIQKYGI